MIRVLIERIRYEHCELTRNFSKFRKILVLFLSEISPLERRQFLAQQSLKLKKVRFFKL